MFIQGRGGVKRRVFPRMVYECALLYVFRTSRGAHYPVNGVIIARVWLIALHWGLRELHEKVVSDCRTIC